MNLNRLDIYKGKRVFLTGHTGFKGAWFLAYLQRLGAEVKGYALAPTGSKDLYNLLKGDTLCKSVMADIRDASKLKKEILDFNPDFIFHFAAQSLVRRSYEIPVETFEINVLGTCHVLEAVRSLDKSCSVILITTDKVYENPENGKFFKESDPLGGNDPYSSSKAAAEVAIQSYRKSFFAPESHDKHGKGIASARAGNVIGGGDYSDDRIFTDIIRHFEAGTAVPVRSPGSIRPWQHVLDALTGYLVLGASLSADPKKFSQPFNFGPAQEDHFSVKELLDHCIRIRGKGTWEQVAGDHTKPEAGLLFLDVSKALKELNWSAKWKAVQAIENTLNWFQVPEKERAAFTFDQIDKHLQG